MKKTFILRLTAIASILIFIFYVLILCTGNKGSELNNSILKVGEGYLSVPEGKIWYKVSGNGKGIPVVLLHGGPGGSSFGLKPFEELGNDRQVIRYDQLGGGKSDKITDTTLFTINHFVEDLELLRQHLGVTHWHILGHSWGTILAIEYYKKYPDNITSIIFTSACLNINLWNQYNRQLLENLPDSFKQAIIKAESSGNYEDSLYMKAIDKFGSLYNCRHPIIADKDSFIATQNDEIYNYMLASRDFKIVGTLKNYDATPFLPEIKVPTLFTVGEFDHSGPEIIKGFANKVHCSKYVVFPGVAHVSMWDARDENVKVVREFLNSVDDMKNEKL